jgi:hypothetical protein
VILVILIGTLFFFKAANPRAELPFLGKSVAQKEREVEKCWLRYGTARMRSCLVAEFNWKTNDAWVEQTRRENMEAGQ